MYRFVATGTRTIETERGSVQTAVGALAVVRTVGTTTTVAVTLGTGSEAMGVRGQ